MKTIEDIRVESGDTPFSPAAEKVLADAQTTDYDITSYCHIVVLDRTCDLTERRAAVWLLGRFEFAPVGPVLQSLAKDEGEVTEIRAEAVRACGRLGASWLSPLVYLSDSAAYSIAEATIYSVGTYAMGEPWGPQLVAGLIKKPLEQDSLRALAVDLLGSAPPDAPGVRDTALAALYDASAEVRFFAINTVGQLGMVDDARDRLVELSHDRSLVDGWGSISDEARQVLGGPQ